MKISVITICYNDTDVAETCKSIAEQKCSNFEWIVIDGGSCEETLSILKAHIERMNVFVSERDNGIYHAMNKGIQRSCGEYVLFLNAGDTFYDENSLNILCKCLDGTDIIYANAQFVSDSGDFLKKCPPQLPFGWFKHDCLPHQATCIKRTLFEKYGYYNESFRIVSDWEKWIVFIDINQCTYKHVDEIVAIHQYNGISSKYDDVHLSERKTVLETYYFPENHCSDSKADVSYLKKLFDATTLLISNLKRLVKLWL